MDKNELYTRIQELKGQGLSIRQIAKALSEELGQPVNKSRVERLLKAPVSTASEPVLPDDETPETTFETEPPPATYAGPETLLPRISPVSLNEEAKEAISEVATEEAHWRQEQIRRAKEIELLERESRALERQARASEMELKTLIAKAQLVGPDEESQQRIQAQIAELQHKAETAEARAHQKELELGEEKHRWQLEQLTTRLNMVEKRGDNQWSFWTHVTNEILPIVGLEMRGLREAIAERAPRQLPNPGMPAVGATALAHQLELKRRFLDGGTLTEPELLEVKALLRREAGLPETTQPGVETKTIWCPSCRTQQDIPVGLARGELAKGNDMTVCTSCRKPIDLKPLFGEVAIIKPAEVTKVVPKSEPKLIYE